MAEQTLVPETVPLVSVQIPLSFTSQLPLFSAFATRPFKYFSYSVHQADLLPLPLTKLFVALSIAMQIHRAGFLAAPYPGISQLTFPMNHPLLFFIFAVNFPRTPSTPINIQMWSLAPQSSLTSYVSHTNLSNQPPFTAVTSMSDSPIGPLKMNRSDGLFKTSKSNSRINSFNSRPLLSLSRPVLTYLLYSRGRWYWRPYLSSSPFPHIQPTTFLIHSKYDPITSLYRQSTDSTPILPHSQSIFTHTPNF